MPNLSEKEKLEMRERYKDLMAKQKRLTKNMDKHKRLYIKSRTEKKRINQELKQLAEEFRRIAAESQAAAEQKILKEMSSVGAGDMFPQDLEREFDALGKVEKRKGVGVINTDDFLVTASEVISGGGQILEDEMDEHNATVPTTDDGDEIPEDIRKSLEDSIELGFGETDLFIQNGVELPDDGKDGVDRVE
jgi:hypothetical protein